MTRQQIDTLNQVANAPGRKVKFTVFRNTAGIMAKRLSLAADGSLVKQTAARMKQGTAETVTSALADLAALLPALDQHEALGLGICDLAPVQIVKEIALPQHPGAVARTQDYFHFPAGPALVYFDGDTAAGMDGLAAAITKALPSFATAEKLAVFSTSAGVYRIGEAEPVAQSKGIHLYTTVLEGEDIPRFGKVLCQRLWLAGHGHIEISKSGAMLVRQIIDGLVFASERIIFEASPVLGKGLERRPPAPVYVAGESLDTSLCADLTGEELVQYHQLVAQAKKEKESEAAKIHAAWLHARGQSIAEARNIPYAQAVAVAEKAAAGMKLEDDFILCFQKFGEVAVADVVADLQKYDGQSLHDPLEWDYKSPYCAIFYANDGEPPVVSSRAHGGQTFVMEGTLARSRLAAAAEAEANEPAEPPPAPKPWEGITDRDVAGAIDGSLLEPMVRILASVTKPPLPMGIALPKALALAGTALSQPIDFDRKTEKRRGIDLARNVIDTAGGQTLNVMACIVYPSGECKDIGNLPSRLAHDEGVGIGHAGSAEGLADAFIENGAGLLTISELGPYLDPKKWQHAATGFLTSAWNQHQVKVVLSLRNGEPRDVRYCAPNVAANVQPEVLADLADPLLMDSGFLNRFLFTYSNTPASRRPNTDPINIEPLRRAFKAYRRMQVRVQVPQNYLQDVLDEFLTHNAPMPGLFNRLINEYGPRFAFMLAVDPNRPQTLTITEDHWRRAGILVRWFYGMACRALEGVGEDRYVRRRETRLERMLAWIRKHPKGVSKKYFTLAFHKGTDAADRDKALRELEDRGQILIQKIGNKFMLKPVLEGEQ